MYAIISDVHGNFEALFAVLSRIDSLGVEKIVCLGDIVGYNADPDQCTEMVFARVAAQVRGNHDKAVAGQMCISYFNETAQEAIQWTRRVMSSENKRRLKTLSRGPVVVHSSFVICHGTPFDEDAYVLDRAVVLKCFAYLARRHEGCVVCFYGHTHIPTVITDAAEVVESGSPVELRKGNRYLINPGSVGQPRDRVSTASFGLFDESSLRYEHCRVGYPIEKTQMKIIRAGLPERLATRIAVGV